jgi:hypothetical protein
MEGVEHEWDNGDLEDRAPFGDDYTPRQALLAGK